MKLYLSSYHLSTQPKQFATLFGANKKVAIIQNAADLFGPELRPQFLHAEIGALHDIGLEGEALDLRDYFGKPDALRTKLQEYGGVWVVGGNSFVLRRAMRFSGFDQIAPEMVRNDQLVYGGFSAGVAVITPTLHGIELVDEPSQVPDGWDPTVIWEGLGLYGFSFAPHYQSDHPESAAINRVVAYFEEHHMPYKALRDGEAIVVDE